MCFITLQLFIHIFSLSMSFLKAHMISIALMMCHAVTQVIPPYNGYGSLEDSLQNCLALVPEPPKKDVIKLLENNHKVLRYIARLVRMHLICIISKRSIALKQRRQREQINVCFKWSGILNSDW